MKRDLRNLDVCNYTAIELDNQNEHARPQAAWAAWREEVAAWHPMPDARSCLDYLVTEVGEAVDARLRMERHNDDRTNSRNRDLARELAQVVDMAYAAAIAYDVDLDAEIERWREEVRQRGQ